MNEEAKRLLAALKDNEELSDKLEEVFDRIFKEGKAASENEAYVAAAKELGFNITLADLENFSNEVQELDMDALDEVAGGRRRLPFRLRRKYTNNNSQD
ncbi:MAG: hypothetical protein K6G42_07490 [Lachnospiraceae bacterium]|nr:hypothetical protein [Lachnospiraceae bacterium]